MAQAFISHRVADYEKWRQGFDADMPKLEDVGVTVIAVLRDADDPLSIWVCIESDRVVGEAFLQDPEIERVMRQSGVLDPYNVMWVT